jgi:hypothetical protein
MADDDYCLKAQKELDLSKSQLKNLVEQINPLEKRYQFDYNPQYLEEKERYYPTPIAVPQDQGYEIPNGLL